MNKHSNISIFVAHIGCPHICSFCNQHTISGAQSAPTAEDVRRICRQAEKEISCPQDTEIAFFGGSFTAIDKCYMTELLKAAYEFVGEGGFKGIRISTRPDCIDRDVLDTLKAYGVTAIELGAQSMCDEVLLANDRGHTADDVERASLLIKEYGFELGLQMMVGLYKSNADRELETMNRIIKIQPDTVRIYPTVVLEGTRLAQLYRSGEYVPAPFDEIISLCADMLEEFSNAGIEVIKCGLHASDGVEGEQVAGYYHPALRELCETLIYRKCMEKAICDSKISGQAVVFAVSVGCISKALGHKKANVAYFKDKDIDIKVTEDKSVPKYRCRIVD